MNGAICFDEHYVGNPLVFCGNERLVKHVMVGGRWIVRDGHHPDEDAIEARYRQLAQQYHPDKVNHLGDELKEVAHEKMLEIAAAYRSLRA